MDGAVVLSDGAWLSADPNAQPVMGVLRLEPGADLGAVRVPVERYVEILLIVAWSAGESCRMNEQRQLGEGNGESDKQGCVVTIGSYVPHAQRPYVRR